MTEVRECRTGVYHTGHISSDDISIQLALAFQIKCGTLKPDIFSGTTYRLLTLQAEIWQIWAFILGHHKAIELSLLPK